MYPGTIWMATGAENGRAKLTDDAAAQIKFDRRSSKVIAKEHGIASGTVRKIRANISWRHIDGA